MSSTPTGATLSGNSSETVATNSSTRRPRRRAPARLSNQGPRDRQGRDLMYLICSVPNWGHAGLVVAVRMNHASQAPHWNHLLWRGNFRSRGVLGGADRHVPPRHRRGQRDRIASSGYGHPSFRLCSRMVQRSKTVSAEDHRVVTALTGARSRRATLQTGGMVLTGIGAQALGLQQSAAALATPTAGAPEGGPLLVQGFTHGSLFPTQGDAGGASYTVILWDAADRGFFFADWTGGVAG